MGDQGGISAIFGGSVRVEWSKTTIFGRDQRHELTPFIILKGSRGVKRVEKRGDPEQKNLELYTHLVAIFAVLKSLLGFDPV